MADIKETKEALEFALALGTNLDKAIQDGVQWTDVFTLIPVMTKLPTAIDGVNAIPAEIKDLSAEEKQELYDVVESLDLESAASEKLIEQGLKIALEIYRMVLMLRAAKK